jgi:acyl-CoA dehydrogenase
VPSDRLGHDVAKLLIEPSPTRDRLTAGMYVTPDESDIIGKLEAALQAAVAAEPIERKLREAQKARTIAGDEPAVLVAQALERGVITPAEQDALERANALRAEVIRVDDFPQDLSVDEAGAPDNAETARAPRAQRRDDVAAEVA